MPDRPPLPPFTAETAAQKVQAAEDAWNSRDPERMSMAYSEDSRWRSYGNELWEFDSHGLMTRREASINDLAIDASERRLFGPRGDEERGADIPLR
jgi:nuclear transport factor 2 (NTF2) superfamily protein